MVRFLLLTGARRGAAKSARNKTKIDLARPLSKTAQDTLPMPRQGEFVFSTTAAPRP
jgi:hypothetical protein